MLNYAADWGKELYDTYSVIKNNEVKIKISNNLLKYIVSNNIEKRIDYTFLSAHWLAYQEELTETDEELLDIIFAGLSDTNTELSSESIRAFAIILRAKSSWINQYISKIVTRTKLVNKTNDLHYIRYLTNYAFMYKQFHEMKIEDNETKEIVDQTIINLKQSPYANVRRELK